MSACDLLQGILVCVIDMDDKKATKNQVANSDIHIP